VYVCYTPTNQELMRYVRNTSVRLTAEYTSMHRGFEH